MDYEKKYKEAQGWIEKIYPTLQHEQQMEAEAFFPELAESEDEMIRKMLIKFFSKGAENNSSTNGISDKDIVAWLEKQGEQKVNYTTLVETGNGGINALVTRELSNSCDYEEKPAEKIEPKFQHGQWIVWQNKCYKVNYNGCGYELIDQNGLRTSLEYGTVDKSAHLWTIQDAKDGDVLCTYECGKPKIVFILKGTPKKHYALSYYCYYNIMYPHFGSDSEKGCLAPNDEDVKPATKEQRELLFTKMKEAGYEWNAEKKELKKIEQKSAWSEEDETSIAINNPDAYKIGFADGEAHAKEEMTTAWSKEDEKEYKYVLKFVDNILNNCGNKKDYEHCKRCYDWLKSLKHRQTVEWEPKDQGRYEDIRDVLRCCMNLDTFTQSAVEADLKWFVERYSNMKQKKILEAE